MKNVRIYFCLLLWQLGGGLLFAQMPNFKGKLEKEALVSVQEINGTEIIQYATDDSFIVLKTKLHRILGKEWIEVSPEKSKRKTEGAFLLGKSGTRPKKLGSVRFESKDHRSVFVHITLEERPSKGKKYTATISKVNIR